MGLFKGIIRILRGVETGKSNDHVPEIDQKEENLKKGHEFENYVVELFNKYYFSIYAWTPDNADKYGGKWVESNKNPDIVMRFKPRDEKFAIECKFRSNLYDGNINWSDDDQIRRYNRFEQETSIPTFVVIGLGGIPSNPERMFCIPIKEAKYPVLFPIIFEKFERKPGNKFYWNGEVLE